METFKFDLSPRKQAAKILLALFVFLVISVPLVALGDVAPGAHTNSMMAESPITSYTVGVMFYMLLVGFLVTVLLGGAFAVLNLGLLSKRAEDQRGNRDPSDVGILKQPYEQVKNVLPALEGEIEDPVTQISARERAAEGVALLSEQQMYTEHKQAA